MSQKILVVDDESGIRTVLSISLMDMGHSVSTAESADEALLQIDQARPSIVLTDIKMPGMDGLELLKAIKTRDPDIEVIMMTGHGDMDLAIQSLKMEATDFITKPIGNEALEIAIHRASERIAMRNQLRQYTEKLEQLVEEKTRRLLETERLAAVGEAIAGLSHTIKNIAGGLRGGMFVLEKGIDMNDATALSQGWEMLKGNAEKLYKLAMDLLNYGKASELSLRWCNPNEPAIRAIETVSGQAKAAGIPIDFEPAAFTGELWMDADAMTTVLSNLLFNALDACMEQPPDKPKSIRLTIADTRDNSVCFRVIDTGIGMDDKTLERILQWFHTTKGTRGTGIGLMTARRTVEKHGGTLRLESKWGHGTTVEIHLPKCT
ncbi:response regulator [Desulfatirhabdium butyrativorans]|uniref:response regulator n=1 Tax=Desulfatirhabdium butyrativorans TaxID=340467 RepID=UPI0003FE2CCC|nr:response regulator [Desulfatirhabdium butyrativorans]